MTTKIMARVPTDLLAAFAAVAHSRERTVSGELRLALREHIARHSEGAHAGAPSLDTTAAKEPRHEETY